MAVEFGGECVVERVGDLAAGIDAMQRFGFDCVLLDLSLPDSDGLLSVETMVARSPHCPVVVLTGLDDSAVAYEALARGAQDYLVKSALTHDVACRAVRYAVARHHTETELRDVQDRLASMHAREQIARDLHDVVIQRLFAAGLTLQAASRLIDREALAQRALTTVDEIDRAIRELRQAIFGLHALDEQELVASELAGLAKAFGDLTGFEPVVRLGALPVLSPDLRHDLAAVVREALSNVAKHAGASHASITVAVQDAALMVRVLDNGSGPPSATATEPAADERLTGQGLNNLGARAKARGGTMTFESVGGGGSELVWTVPLD